MHDLNRIKMLTDCFGWTISSYHQTNIIWLFRSGCYSLFLMNHQFCRFIERERERESEVSLGAIKSAEVCPWTHQGTVLCARACLGNHVTKRLNAAAVGTQLGRVLHPHTAALLSSWLQASFYTKQQRHFDIVLGYCREKWLFYFFANNPRVYHMATIKHI